MAKKKGSVKNLLLGIGVGAALGALLTPRTGEENRKLLKEKANKTYKKVKNVDYDALKDKLYDEYYDLKNKLENMDAEDAKEYAIEKAKEIEAKADKVIAKAIEDNKPKVEKSLTELKKKVASLLKDASKKLED